MWRLTHGTILKLLWSQFRNMHNLQVEHQPHMSSTCPVTSPDGSFPAHRGAQHWTCADTTPQPQGRLGDVKQKTQQVGGSTNVLWLLLSAVQLCTLFLSFSAIIAALIPLQKTAHLMLSGLIDCLLWFSFLYRACRGKYLENSQPLSRLCCDTSFADLKEHSLNATKYSILNKQEYLWHTLSTLCHQHSLIHWCGSYPQTKC